MAVEAITNEDATEDTCLVEDHLEPDDEPRCWTHHSNSCGCRPEDQGLDLDMGEERFSKEPPLPPGDRPMTDILMDPRAW
ncbi:hypothetical protein ACIGW8_20120 [Streptomyces sioyaensis]|uniref:hypothetical protein n=1 Tax=Streptomyces sioyaensis TaxID=67364 RepID=UPI0037D09C69